MRRPRTFIGTVAVVGLAGFLVSGPQVPVGASSHREAPLSSQDPTSDLTDLYAFVSPDKTDSITFVMNVIPFEKPDGGPNFDRFGDDVLYTFNIDTDGDARPNKQYQFKFSTQVINPNSYVYNKGPVTSLQDEDLNVKQFYTLTQVDLDRGRSRTSLLGTGFMAAPANVGARSTPDYEQNLGGPAVATLDNGIKVFAGDRDDPFFVDLGSLFDLGGLRPLNDAHLAPLPVEKGFNSVGGYNVHSIVLQVPTAELVRLFGDPVIGVWATTSRRATRVLGNDGSLSNRGKWVQVSRLGMPLVNEVIIPLGMKDRFNASSPSKDLQFLNNVLHPELGMLIPVLYPGVKVPTDVDAGLGLGGREDLATVFLTGIPGVNQPMNVVPSEQLRLNALSPKSQFPNGRPLTDDVIDASLRTVAGATAFSPEFNIAPNNALGDGVDKNDQPFLDRFPYLAPPASGYSDPVANNS